MKIIRCKNCGMSIKVDEGEFVKVCPICNTKNLVSNAEEVNNADEFYDVNQYHSDSEEHAKNHIFVDRVEEEKKAKQRAHFRMQQNDFSKRQQNTVKGISFFIIAFAFVLFFIMFFFFIGSVL